MNKFKLIIVLILSSISTLVYGLDQNNSENFNSEQTTLPHLGPAPFLGQSPPSTPTQVPAEKSDSGQGEKKQADKETSKTNSEQKPQSNNSTNINTTDGKAAKTDQDQGNNAVVQPKNEDDLIRGY